MKTKNKFLAAMRGLSAAASLAMLAGCGAPPPPVALDGTDACEHAKRMLVRANEVCSEDCNSIFPRISGNAQNQVMVAAHAVKAVCTDAEGENTWACAEGHSCR